MITKRICRRCGKIYKKSESPNYCEDCKREITDDNGDIEVLEDDGWKDYY